MNYFSAEDLSKSFGEQLLFEGITFGLARGDKTALIARNGTGKTTLLRILMGKMAADSGEFTFRRGIRTAFLEQVPELDGSMTVGQVISTTNTPLLDVIKRYENALGEHSLQQSRETARNLEEVTNEMDRTGAWDYERRLKQLLTLFRITDTSQLVSNLSGGGKKRLALAMILLDEPDLLILDEPTNHLDIDMIEWLEQYLAQSNLTLLMVTHDRYFLDRICNRIMELHQGKLYHYEANYELFLQKRAERQEIARAGSEKAGQLMKRELEWLRTMPKARTGKSKARIDAFEGIRERAAPVTDEGEMLFRIGTPRLGTRILELDGISKSYGPVTILDKFSYKFSKGERLGLIGRNGTGKTAFLDLITGWVQMDAGTMMKGKTVQIGYYRQMGQEWKKEMRVIEAVKEIAEIVKLEDGRTISASQFLEHFMFSPESQYKMVSALSGGELRRLHLLTVLMTNPNFLVLDEPTNDLDLFALNRLEEYLLSFTGCLVIVSHDRYFLDKLTDHLFVFEGEGIIHDYYGTCSAYRRSGEKAVKGSKRAAPKEAEVLKDQPPESKGPGPKKKLTYREQQEYDLLEPEIEKLEQEKRGLEAELGSGVLDYDDLERKSRRIAEIISLVEQKMQRWLELGQYAS